MTSLCDPARLYWIAQYISFWITLVGLLPPVGSLVRVARLRAEGDDGVWFVLSALTWICFFYRLRWLIFSQRVPNRLDDLISGTALCVLSSLVTVAVFVIRRRRVAGWW